MDELGKSFPAAEGMVDAEESTTKKNHNENCLNCGTKLVDIFCHHCGQKDIPRRQTLRELFSNFLSSFWSYEGKFFQTTKYLIIKPGFLAVEYNAGRRESYFHPARMYVFISFVFFLLFFSLPDRDKEATKEVTKDLSDEDVKELKENYSKADLDSILQSIPGQDSTLNAISPGLMDTIKRKSEKKKKKGGLNWGLKEAEFKTVQAYDSAQLVKAEKDRDGWMKKKLIVRAIELNQKYGDDRSKFGQDFVAAFKDNFSKMLFYLLPVFALLLKLLYMRRDFYYSEHLVFSIYYYNFFYLAASLQMLLNLIPGFDDWVGTVIGFWIFFYMLFGMKRMYEQRWGKTILKFFVFHFIFFWIALLGFGITAMVILMVI